MKYPHRHFASVVHATRPPEPVSGRGRSIGFQRNSRANKPESRQRAGTGGWLALGDPRGGSWLTREAQPAPQAKVRIIEGEEARRLGPEEKWDLLSPFLKQHGREGIAYATLQAGMEVLHR